MNLNIKEDRIKIANIIKNCLPLIKKNDNFIQECSDAIIVYLIEKDAKKLDFKTISKTINSFSHKGTCDVCNKKNINVTNECEICYKKWMKKMR